MITVEEAKKILKENAKGLSDKDIQELINTFVVMSDLAIDSYLEKRKKEATNR